MENGDANLDDISDECVKCSRMLTFISRPSDTNVKLHRVALSHIHFAKVEDNVKTTAIGLHKFSNPSVRGGDMTINIEVASDLGQGELNAIQLRGEDNLTAQAGVLLKHWSHVQHIILPICARGINSVMKSA